MQVATSEELSESLIAVLASGCRGSGLQGAERYSWSHASHEPGWTPARPNHSERNWLSSRLNALAAACAPHRQEARQPLLAPLPKAASRLEHKRKSSPHSGSAPLPWDAARRGP